MAIFEAEGYCPQTAIWRWNIDHSGNVATDYEEVYSLLRSTMGYMVYPDPERTLQYAPELFCGAHANSSSLGRTLASKLKQLHPTRIELYDCKDYSDLLQGETLLSDERFTVVLSTVGGVQVYIFKQ